MHSLSETPIYLSKQSKIATILLSLFIFNLTWPCFLTFRQQKTSRFTMWWPRPTIWTPGRGYLRASFCKYRESGDSFKIFNFLIFCPNKAFSELFSKIQLKDPKALEFFQNRGKFENRHFGLPPPLKIDKNDAFSFRSCW